MVKHGAQRSRRSFARGVRLTISLPREDYDRLRVEAERMRVSLAWVIRRAVQSYAAESDPSLQLGRSKRGAEPG